MARRRRLDPAELAAARPAPETRAAGLPPAAPPIARVAGESAGGGERALAMADEAGRLVHAVPLERVYVAQLTRDRIRSSEEGLAALRASILAHGQRVPVEIMPRGSDEEEAARMPFGLISGWRRMAVLRDLAREHPGDARFATVRAFIRRPGSLREAYVAMVEENEIREDVSHFERARVALAAAREGVFDSVEAAVDTLYAAGSKARRSKIRSFVTVVEELGAALVWPQAVNERLGLRLAEAIRDGRGARLARALESGDYEDAAGQNAVLEAVLKDRIAKAPPPSRARPPVEDGAEDGAGTRLDAGRDAPLFERRIAGGITVTMRATAAGSRVDIAGHVLSDHQVQILAGTLDLLLTPDGD